MGRYLSGQTGRDISIKSDNNYWKYQKKKLPGFSKLDSY